ncbi:MAG: ethanolamine ammonia-lyase reactivating factor EutA [Clostridia bacterium]|nr:ethanolamine ammonia-lyase reactivating factor EutA [Clostridia bacterium]
MQETLLSVGIDLGTSTTQLIFSRLHIKNRSQGAAVPKMEIYKKEILYKSDIHFTPLKSPIEIDAQKVLEILKQEYGKAGFSPQDTDTGAVIITGETARKENAAKVLEILSEFSGDFVVATAGADLESVLSAKGAGVDKISKAQKCGVVNADIGGGTTNLAVYKNGILLDTACLDIGGRLIRYDQNQIITYIAPKLKQIIQKENLCLAEGKKLDIDHLNIVLDCMVNALFCDLGKTQSPYRDLLITHRGLENTENITHISFSGGVAEGIYTHIQNPFAFGDIGVFLAEKIKNSPCFSKFQLVQGNETIRATVVGAGSHAVSLSGSTVYFHSEILPLKNIPVSVISALNPTLPETDSATLFTVTDICDTSFSALNALAEKIAKQAKHKLLLFNFEADIGKSFGYILQSKLPHATLISMDGLHLKAGDYIDIGNPAANGTVLPVVIKTLLFQ